MNVESGSSVTSPHTCHARYGRRARPCEGCPNLRDILIGESAAMRLVRRLIGRLGPAESNVMITGESGTGKELVARAIHHASLRPGGPFLPVNVAAIPRELVESQLFGHERGAFSGAETARAGAFRSASSGTVFLDEIGELALDVQAKLLRAIEEKEVYPVGSDRPARVDVRIVAATHRDLAGMVEAGQFRRDLYFRLQVVELHLPPLRERSEDIPALAEHFLAERAAAMDVPGFDVEPAVMAAWLAHDWKGNVRELANVIERATLLGDGVMLRLSDLPGPMQRDTGDVVDDLERATAAFQRRHIARVLAEVGGCRRAAAQALGISEATLYRKLDLLRPEADR